MDLYSKIKKPVTIGVIITISLLIWGLIFIIFLSRDLPSLEQLEKYEPKLISKIYSKNGELIKEISGEENRVWVPYDELPQYLIDALIAQEDRSFYDHWGVNLHNFLGSLYRNIKSLSFERGFSTITMQLARDITYMTRQKLLVRKFKEILTALKIEKTYTKREIIEMYLNQYDFGRMSFGIESVAFTYFSKHAKDLTLEESALVISLLPAPSYYSPIKNIELSKQRRNLVLKSMLDMGFITEKVYSETIKKPIVLNPGYRSSKDKAPYFSEYVRKLVEDKEDELGVDIDEDGLSIYTTLDLKLQKIAEESLIGRLDELQRDMRFYLKRRANETGADTTIQGSFIAIDPRNGHILALVGGRDFYESPFCRATQAKRQPGSCFKPFVWTAAIHSGYSPNTELYDQEVVIHQYGKPDWRPQNYTKERGGLTTLREGLKRSLNNISTRIIGELLQNPNIVVQYAHNMGIKSYLNPVLSIALGTSEVTLLELASAFCVFPNKGIYIEPTAIDSILDRSGKKIYESVPEEKEVISAETAYLMVSMFQSAMEPGGTGQSARSIFGLKRPAGGKTGTTQEFTDAWYMGFIPQMVAGTWVGFDDPQITLGQRRSGAVVALPIWARFMKTACDSLNIPVENFEMPDGVIPLNICKETKLIATKYCPKIEHEVFDRKYAPTDTCPKHNPFAGR